MLALFNIYLTNIFEFWGLKHLTSFKTCFIYSLSPFLSALLSYLVLKETLSAKKWAGLVLGFLAMGPILFMDSSVSESLSGHFFLFSWAELSVLVAVFCGVYGWILLRQVVCSQNIPPLFANGFSMLLGGVMALVHSLLVERWDPIPVTEVLPFLQYFFILLVISNLLAYNLYGYLLKRYTATFMSVAGAMTPLFAALFGWYFLGEEVTLAFYLSCGILFIGLSLFHQEELYSVQLKAGKFDKEMP